MTEAEQVMKRCQIGTRNYDEANNLHADCHRVIGKLLAEHAMREVQRLGQEIEQCNYPDCKCPTENPCLKGLAQPEQEPVGTVKDLFTQAAWEKLDVRGSTKVYLDTPPQRKPLTDEQIWDAYMKAPVDIDCHVSDLHKFARAIEAAHGIKENT